MVRWLFLVSVSVGFLLLSGCDRNPPPQPSVPASTTEPAAPAESSDAQLANTLAELTQALRKFSAEQRRVPSSLNELAASGAIKNIPPAPPGKSFVIDQKNLKVILK